MKVQFDHAGKKHAVKNDQPVQLYSGVHLIGNYTELNVL